MSDAVSVFIAGRRARTEEATDLAGRAPSSASLAAILTHPFTNDSDLLGAARAGLLPRYSASFLLATLA